MSNSWDTKVQLTSSAPERVEASASVRDDSPFFDGHFPDHPVVPGIAMLSMVEDAVALTPGAPRVTGFRRVRFRSPASGLAVGSVCQGRPPLPLETLLGRTRQIIAY